jgi:hypothetical protein
MTIRAAAGHPHPSYTVTGWKMPILFSPSLSLLSKSKLIVSGRLIAMSKEDQLIKEGTFQLYNETGNC